MKRTISLFLVLLFVAIAFASCAQTITKVNVKIVVDQGDNGTYDEILFDGEVELSGKEPSIDTIINQLTNEEEITTEFSQDDDGNTAVVSINGKENKDEGTSPMTIYQWFALKNNSEVKGLWSDNIVEDGDNIVIKYSIWEFDDSEA